MWTRDVSDNQIGPDSDTSVIASLNWDRVYPLAGPIEVSGAEPGDTLAVEILDIHTQGWGWTAILPGLGLLADDFPDGRYKVTRLDGGDRAEFWPGIHVPIAPFCGELGVAPAAGPLSTIPPDVHGGNMDTRHLVAGSTLFLPVFEKTEIRLAQAD